MAETVELSPAPPSSPPQRRGTWWIYAAPVFVVLHGVVLAVVHSRPGPIGALVWYLGPFLLRVLAGLMLVVAVAVSAIRRPFWTRRRSFGFAALVLLLWLPFLYRTYPSSYDDRPSEVAFRLPLDGPITICWGGREPGHHGAAPDQRWAYDMLVTKNHHLFGPDDDGRELDDYFCYGMTVLAPAAGVVEAVVDGLPDVQIGESDSRNAAGNHVVLKVADRQFLFLCHMQPGSITVKKGDQVTAGQELAHVGNSGNTSQPHLHVQLQDTPRLHFGEGIPIHFRKYRSNGSVIERGMPNGGVSWGELVGEIVEHVGDD